MYSDIDECATSNGGCQHVCKNNDGSHQCLCNGGYTLGADKHSCEGKVTDLISLYISFTFLRY